MKHRTSAIFLGLVVLMGCERQPTSVRQPTTKAVELPSLEYRVSRIGNSEMRQYVRTDVKIRINEKPGLPQLDLIARKVDSELTGADKRPNVAVTFHVSDADLSTSTSWGVVIKEQGVWAAPQRWGFTAEQEANFRNEAMPTDRTVIGRWLSESAQWDGWHMLYRKGGKTFLHRRFATGPDTTHEMLESKSAKGRVFIMKGKSKDDDGNWVIAADGSLLVMSGPDVSTVARPI